MNIITQQSGTEAEPYVSLLARAKIVAPDSSHWAKWFDATGSQDPKRRDDALRLYERMIERGRIPLLSFHHLEELLAVDNEDLAMARLEFIRNLPVIAWFRSPSRRGGVGSIVQLLSAEAIAYLEGRRGLIEIRDRARTLALATGSGAQALGRDVGPWMAIRLLLLDRRLVSDMMATVGPFRTFDESKTIGELASTGWILPPALVRHRLRETRAKTLAQALEATGGDQDKAERIADMFIGRVAEQTLSPKPTVREMLTATLLADGVDEHEIRDDSVLADLNRLSLLRGQLRVAADGAGHTFEDLKRIPLDVLPSQLLSEALRRHGQLRERRPGSDMNDGFLAVLAAYCDELYVDKRTAEDLRRVRAKDRKFAEMFGDVIKSANFNDLSGAPA